MQCFLSPDPLIFGGIPPFASPTSVRVGISHTEAFILD